MGSQQEPNRPTDGPDARDIARLLNADAEALCGTLLPGGRKLGGFWTVGSIHGEAGESMRVHLSGAKRGGWADYSRDAGDPAGKGDMLKLVQLTVGNGSMTEALRWARGWLGPDRLDRGSISRLRDKARERAEKAEAEQQGEREQKRRKAVGLWLHAHAMAGTPAERYLAARGIDFARLGGHPGAIRFHGSVWNSERRAKMPAMLAMYVGIFAPMQRAVHITYLDLIGGQWVKARVEDAKKTWSPMYWGAHIPLHDGGRPGTLRDVAEGTALYLSEGIEDGLTVAMLDPSRRVAAAGTLGNIGAIELPVQLGDLILIGQHDKPGSPADKSLEQQIARQQEQAARHGADSGEPRRIMAIWPSAGFKDFNDELRGVRMAG